MELIDREEFELRLNRCLDPLYKIDLKYIINCLVNNDKDNICKYRVKNKKSKDKINEYLLKYDNSKTDEEKINVVGSVIYEQFTATQEEIDKEKLKMETEL